jgi:hypothetical protein
MEFRMSIGAPIYRQEGRLALVIAVALSIAALQPQFAWGQAGSLQRPIESLVDRAIKQGSVNPQEVQSQLQSSGIQIDAKQADALKTQVEILAESGITQEIQQVLAGSQNVDQMLKGLSNAQKRLKNLQLPEVKFADGSLAPDLIVETLNVHENEQDKRTFDLVAVLRNGVKDEQKQRADYPGGGKFIIHQMNETINLDGQLNLDFTQRGKVIAEQEIPRLKSGQSIRLKVTADGGSFTAITIPVTTDADPRNNYKQVFKTAKISLTVTEQMMKDWIKPLEMKVHIHETGSYALFNEQKYDIPKIPRKTVDIKIGELVYYANQINSSKISFDLKKSVVEWNIVFETDGPEIRGEAPGALSDKLAPDVNADPIKVKISIPFHFDADKQLVKLDDPKVSMTAQWSLNITLLPKDVRDSLVKDEWINRPVEAGITNAFRQHRAYIEKTLNAEIQKKLNGGNITRMTPADDQILIEAEAKLTGGIRR